MSREACASISAELIATHIVVSVDLTKFLGSAFLEKLDSCIGELRRFVEDNASNTTRAVARRLHPLRIELFALACMSGIVGQNVQHASLRLRAAEGVTHIVVLQN